MIATRACLITLLLIASSAYATPPDASRSASAGAGVNSSTNASARIVPVDDRTTQRVQTDGRGAHLGHELCGFSDAGIARYKAALRRSLGNPANFDYAWQYGWGRADSVLLEYQTLHSTDPQDYETRVRRICATLRRIGEKVEKSSDKGSNAASENASDESVNKPTNQSTNKPTNQPTNQPSNNAVGQPASAP